MTLSQLALLYYKEGCRGHPVGESQSRRLFRDDLYFANGKFKAIRVLLKRMGWYPGRRLTPAHIQLIYSRLDNF